jgi:hypothetical protein
MMSYNDFVTQEGRVYTALVCEPFRDGFIVDIADGADGLILEFPDHPHIKTGDTIKFKKENGRFILMADQQNPTSC